MHLVRSIVYARCARLTVHRFKGRVAGNTEGAVNLDRAVDYIVQNLCAEALDYRYLNAGGLAAVDLLRGVHRDQARRLDFGDGFCDPVSCRLLVGDSAAERA